MSADADDSALVTRVRAGDAAAFQEIFERYVTPLAGFAESITGSADVAHDVVHDVLLRVWVNRATWNPEHGVAAYLFTAVRNVARTALRDAATSSRSLAAFSPADEPIAMATPADDGLTAASAAERATLLHAALARLDVRRQQVLLLRWGGGMRTREIAAVLGMSVRAVENLHLRAMAELRTLLRDRFP